MATSTRFLGFELPDVVVQKLLHSARVTIWCAVSGRGTFGPYFFEDDAQNLLTVNQGRYREINIAPFLQDLKRFCRARNRPLLRQWMHQDGAKAHTAWESHACLQQHFGDLLISRGTEFPFPSYSPYLTAPDAYIWSKLEESVFRSDDLPGNVLELREKMQSFLVSLQQPVFMSMSNNLKDLYERCVRREGNILNTCCTDAFRYVLY